MVWFLITVVSLIAVLALLALVVLVGLFVDDAGAEHAMNEQALIELEVRRAERRLHEIARDSFQGMLDEARRHNIGRAS